MSGLSIVIIVIIVLCLSSHHSGCHSFDGSIIARSQLFSDICFGVVFMGKDYSNPILLYSGDNVFISTFNRIKTCTECINQTWRGEVDTKNNVGHLKWKYCCWQCTYLRHLDGSVGGDCAPHMAAKTGNNKWFRLSTLSSTNIYRLMTCYYRNDWNICGL